MECFKPGAYELDQGTKNISQKDELCERSQYIWNGKYVYRNILAPPLWPAQSGSPQPLGIRCYCPTLTPHDQSCPYRAPPRWLGVTIKLPINWPWRNGVKGPSADILIGRFYFCNLHWEWKWFGTWLHFWQCQHFLEPAKRIARKLKLTGLIWQVDKPKHKLPHQPLPSERPPTPPTAGRGAPNVGTPTGNQAEKERPPRSTYFCCRVGGEVTRRRQGLLRHIL